jgi:hypothetical protein
MPRRSSSQPQAQLAQLTPVAMQQGIDRLRKRVDEVRAFDPTSVTEQNNIPHVKALSASVDEALVHLVQALSTTSATWPPDILTMVLITTRTASQLSRFALHLLVQKPDP